MTYNRNLDKKKYKIIYTVVSIAVIAIVCVGCNILGVSNKLEMKSRVLNSSDINIENLASKSKEYPKVNKILRNIDLYPMSLIDLASKNEETIDFVADYPKYSEKVNTENKSIKKDYVKGEIPLFIQWDKRWGYDKYGSEFMAINGCGPTSLAMVVVGLTENTEINPKVVAEYSRDNGYLVNGVGSSWSLMTEGSKNFGVLGTEIPLSENTIISKLKNGQPIIASMGPGEFTTQGHYIVLTGVDDNGRIVVNDSNSKLRSEKTWDIDVFMRETKNLWVFKLA